MESTDCEKKADGTAWVVERAELNSLTAAHCRALRAWLLLRPRRGLRIEVPLKGGE